MFAAGNGALKGTPLLHLSEVKAVEFSPDSKFILTGSLDRTVRLWDFLTDATTGRLLGHPLWHQQEVFDVAFVSNGAADADMSSSLLTVSDNLAQMWNIAMGTPALADRVGPTVLSGARIPAEAEAEDEGDGGGRGTQQRPERLAIVGTTGLVGKTRVFHVNTLPPEERRDADAASRDPFAGLVEVRVFRHDHTATCVAAGATWGVVGLENGRVLRVNWDTGEEQVLPERHSGSAICAAVSRDGVYAATVGEDGLILVWWLQTGKFVGPIQHPTAGHIRALAFDPLKPNEMLIVGADGNVMFCDCVSGEPRGESLRHPAAATCAAYAEDGLTLAVGLVVGGQLWYRRSKTDDWKPGARLEGESETLRIVVWGPRQLVATGDLQGNVRFWHAGTGEPIGPPLANQGMVTVLIGSQDDVMSGTSSGSIRQWPLPQSTNDAADLLKAWSEAATGVRLLDQQSVDHLKADDWREENGQLEVDGLNNLLRQRYGQPVPRLQRTPGESTEHRSMLQDTLQTSLCERPRFHPPTLEYLDRYLPSDTEAVIGLDWRQVVAAPLGWLVSMSQRNFLFDMIQWKELMDVCGVHPLLDIQYVLLAAPRHAISPDLLQGRQLPGLTVLLKAEFDTEQLRSAVRRAAESMPDKLHIEERSDGERILVYQHSDNSPTVHITIIEEGDGGTLVGSLNREIVERALDALPGDRLDPEFRRCLNSTARNHSLWFVARKAIVHPDLFATFAESALPEQVRGGATVFTHWEYVVHATYPDSQTLQAVIEAVKRYPSWDKINLYVFLLADRF